MRKLSHSERKVYVKNNLGLVNYVIKKFFWWTDALGKDTKNNNFFLLEYEDLFNEGIIGLMEASKRFDRGRKLNFSTYAVYYIRSQIQKALFNCGNRVLRYPKNIHLLKYNIDKQCKEQGLSYIELLENGKISINDFKRLDSIVNTANYCQITEIGNNLCTISQFKSSMLKDKKHRIKIMVWDIVKDIYKNNRLRNYKIICLKLGLDNELIGDSYRDICSYIKRKYRNGSVSIYTIRCIVFQILFIFKQRYKKETILSL